MLLVDRTHHDIAEMGGQVRQDHDFLSALFPLFNSSPIPCWRRDAFCSLVLMHAQYTHQAAARGQDGPVVDEMIRSRQRMAEEEGDAHACTQQHSTMAKPIRPGAAVIGTPPLIKGGFNRLISC
jgi:hypothetical protein